MHTVMTPQQRQQKAAARLHADQQAMSMGGWYVYTLSDWSLSVRCASVCTLCRMGSQSEQALHRVDRDA
jgi:hypothetical protein